MNGCTHAHEPRSTHSPPGLQELLDRKYHWSSHTINLQLSKFTQVPPWIIFEISHIYWYTTIFISFCGQFYISFLNPACQTFLKIMKKVWPTLAKLIKSSMYKNRQMQIIFSSFCEPNVKRYWTALCFSSQKRGSDLKKKISKWQCRRAWCWLVMLLSNVI